MTDELAVDPNIASQDAKSPEPFSIAHLDLEGIMAVLGQIMPLAAGQPATIETMARALTPYPPALIGLGVTPEIALECVFWAIDIKAKRREEMIAHRKQGAAIGMAGATVRARFKITGKRLGMARNKLGKSMWRPSRKSSEPRA